MLSVPHAEALLQRLGDPTVTFPRLAEPFPLWGALLKHPEWRQKLFQSRQGDFSRAPVSAVAQVHLSKWFEAIFTVGWQSLDSLSDEETNSFATRFRSPLALNQNEVRQAKRIDLETQSTSRSIALLIGLRPEANDKLGIQAQLHPTSGYEYLPESVRLALLSDSGEVLQAIQAESQDYYIQLNRFKCPLGYCFSLKVELGECSIVEDFIA